VTATGTVSADTTVQVGTQVNGTVAKIFVDFNSMVRKGQIIAILDSTFLAASRDDAQANLDKAQAQADQYAREFARTKKLYDESVATQTDYDLALTNLQLGKANISSAAAQLRRAKINLQYAIIRAPISGTVISRNVDVGQTVISSFNTPTLFSIANNLKKMEVQANIDEADIGQIRRGESVSFTVDAYLNETFKGIVTEIRMQPVIIQNVVNYVVIIEVPNPKLKLMPGMTANINVKVQERKDVLKIPVTALHFTPPAEYFASLKNRKNDSVKVSPEQKIKVAEPDSVATVWALEENGLSPVQVITGISDGTYMEVKGSLTEGDMLVTGLNQNSKGTTTSQNPFMPKMPGRRIR
jgi:HlyD family secretion protein